MNLVKLDIVDWEPCVLRFVFGLPPKEFGARFERFVRQWLQSREDRHTCACRYRFAQFQEELTQRAVIVRSEWLCELCAQELANAVQSEFPALQKVELGVRANHSPATGPEFLQILPKQVEFENSKRLEVKAFLIARHPVTISEFEKFVQDTGFVTLAEHQASSETFREHCGLSGLAASIRLDAPVQFVTLADAQAFCNYARCRLPTEAEWLAAAVIESGERPLNPLEELRMLTGPPPANLMEVNNWDLTATSPGNGVVVARRGPVRFLKEGWRQEPLLSFNRRLLKPNDYDMSVTFRLAK